MRLLFFFMFIKIPLFSQDYSVYYQNINLAEISLSDYTWQKAADEYKTAFDTGLSPFGKDLYNAILCNIEIDSLDRAVYYCELLFLKGLPLNFLENQKFKKIQNSTLWNEIKKKYSTSKKIFRESTDSDLKEDFEKRYKKDQLVHDVNRRKYFYENALWLKRCIESNKFPSENRIGVSIDDEQNIISSSKLEMFIYHWSEVDKDDTLNLIPLLKELVKKGELHPTSLAYANYKNISHLYSSMNNFAYIIAGDDILTPQLDSLKLTVINSNRRDMNLNSFENYQKIVRFAFRDKKFIFNNSRVLKLSEGSGRLFLNNGYSIVKNLKIED
jgi:hypothetical protein